MSSGGSISGKRRELSQSSSGDPLSPKRIRRESTSDIISSRNCSTSETSISAKLDTISLKAADDQNTFSNSNSETRRDNDISSSSLSSPSSDLAGAISFESDAKAGAGVSDIVRCADLDHAREHAQLPSTLNLAPNKLPNASLSSPSPEPHDRSHGLGIRGADENAAEQECSAKAAYTTRKLGNAHPPSHEYNNTSKAPKTSEGDCYHGSTRIVDHPSHSQRQNPEEATTPQQQTAVVQVSNTLPILQQFQQNDNNSKSRRALPDLSLTPGSINKWHSDQDKHYSPTAPVNLLNLSSPRPPLHVGGSDSVQLRSSFSPKMHTSPEIGASIPWSYGVTAASTSQQTTAAQLTQNKHAMPHVSPGPHPVATVSRPVFTLGPKHPNYRFETQASNTSSSIGVQSILPKFAAGSQGLASTVPPRILDESNSGRPPVLPLPILSGIPGSPASQWPQLYAVTFTLDNRAESRLSSAKVAMLMDTITRVASIVASPKHASSRKSSCSVSAVIWSCLGDFRGWYSRVSQMTGVENLLFQFPDAESMSSKNFLLSMASAQSFRDLKQKVWDAFWATYHLKGSNISSFPILVFPDTEFQATISSIPAQISPTRITSKSRSTSPPQNRPTTASLDQALFSDSTASARIWSPPALERPPSIHVSPRVTAHKPTNQNTVSEERNRRPIALSQSPPPLRSSRGIECHPTVSPETRAVDITLRLQTDAAGRYSSEYDKAYLRPSITTEEFFRWFTAQTGYLAPHGPSSLKFTLMHAMPTIKEDTVKRGNEEHFAYLRKEIKAQFAKAKEFLPGLKEFVVLVKAAEWVEEEMNDVW